MGTFLTDKCEEIRKWLAIGADVYPDLIVTGWIRMAEEYLSTELRVKHMVQIDTCQLIEDRVPLPLDWQEVRLVRFKDTGGVMRYNTPDDFYNPEFPDPPLSPFGYRNKRYTIIGNFLVVGNVDSVGGTRVELAYYQNIPALTNDADNWINKYHPTVYTLKILHIASLYAIEDERSANWDKETVRSIESMNKAHLIDKASGSVLVQARRKTFG